MGQADYLDLGDWNFICDVCGFKFKASEGRRRWDGVYVCRQDFEYRHPQEKRRPIRDDMSVEWTRPEDTVDKFLINNYTGILSTTDINNDVGDTDTALLPDSSKYTQIYTTPITANRVVTLSTVGAINTSAFRIAQVASVAFTIDVGGLRFIPANTPAVVDVQFDGNAWVAVDYGILI